MRLRARWARQDGAAAVEMALLTPLLVLILYGVIEFGVIFAQDLGMGNGAREGARFAASTPSLECNDANDTNDTNRDLIQVVQDATKTTLLDPAVEPLRIQVFLEDATGTQTRRCGIGPGGGDVMTSVADQGVCEDPPGDAPHRVLVQSEWERGLSIPFGPVADDFTVNGTGVFVCEYN